MGKTLIVGEIQKGALREATLELVTVARKLGGEVVSLVIGSGVGAQAEELAKKGGGKVLLADDDSLANYNLDGWARAIKRAIDAEKPDLVLLSNTPIGWDVAGALAAQLDCGDRHRRAQARGRRRGPGLRAAHVQRASSTRACASPARRGSSRMQPGASEAYSGSESRARSRSSTVSAATCARSSSRSASRPPAATT